MTRDELNALGAEILDACIAVHKELGPGLLESVYVFALKKELELRGIPSETEVKISLYYKGYDTGKYYEIDLLVKKEIVLEAKAVEIMHPVYEAQIISHLKLTDKRLGYLVNFNVVRLKDGFRRFVNKF
jgi:GxxExxY protein